MIDDVSPQAGGGGLPAPILPSRDAMSLEMLASLLEMAEKAGLSIPGREHGTQIAPSLRLEDGWRALGHKLGGCLRRQNIFRKAGNLGRVNERTGAFELFSPANFAGWVEEFVAFTWKGAVSPLNAEQARMMMAQFSFIEQIREIEGVHLMRLPVMREGGEVEWLPAGYDEATRIFTVETLRYAMDWPLDKALEFLRGWCKDFPWMRAEGQQGASLESVRSYAAHVMAMVGMYCRALVPVTAARPMFFYVANQQGSGKSTLAQMAFAPVLGLFAAAQMPKDEDKLQSLLDTTAQNFSPVLFLDDLGNFIKSNSLNRFVLAPRHTGRPMGQNKEMFDVANVTQVYATGNNMSGSADLSRRAVVVELFFAGETKGRKFEKVVSPVELGEVDARCGFLSALCAIVRNYAEKKGDFAESLGAIEPMASFEKWSRTMAGIVQLAGFANPLAAPLCAFDEEGDEIKDLLIAAASACEVEPVFNRESLAEIAREKGLLEDVVGRGEKDMDGKQSKRFGFRLKAWRGRVLVDTRGRRFEFGKARQRTGAAYPLTFLDQGAQA